MAALIYLLDYLATHDLTLAGLLKEIPAIKIREQEIPVPGLKRDGLSPPNQESSHYKTEMIDGLKIHHRRVGPDPTDPERPSYHVYGEGYSEEIRPPDRSLCEPDQCAPARVLKGSIAERLPGKINPTDYPVPLNFIPRFLAHYGFETTDTFDLNHKLITGVKTANPGGGASNNYITGQ